MEYTDQNVIELYNQNLTYSEMGEKFGKTRSMISSKVKRLRRKFPDALPRRVEGRHPRGLPSSPYSRTPRPPKKPKEEKKAVVKTPVLHSNKYTIRTRPYQYVEPSKAALREMLRKAVENT